MEYKMKIILKTLRFLVFFALFLVAASQIACDKATLYNQSHEIPDSGWHKDSLAYFSMEIEDSVQPCNFYINVRNTDDYPFRNLYVFLTTKLPNNNITRDTIELILADASGKWIGKGFGALRDNQIIIRKNLIFPVKGIYRFGIEQAMRHEYLTGIKDVGIKVEMAR
jgi:gliding motility-associated lipoprotein GldH